MCSALGEEFLLPGSHACLPPPLLVTQPFHTTFPYITCAAQLRFFSRLASQLFIPPPALQTTKGVNIILLLHSLAVAGGDCIYPPFPFRVPRIPSFTTMENKPTFICVNMMGAAGKLLI